MLSEGKKTVAFEVAEQLAWQAPLAVNGTSGESFASTMLIKIDNSIANRKLLLPVLVTLEGCNDTTPSNCTLQPVNTTAVTSCIR